MLNVIFWKNKAPADPWHCESWFYGHKFGYHWLCQQYQSVLQDLNLSATFIIYADPIADIGQYVKSIDDPNIILLQQDHLHYRNLDHPYPVSENILELINLATAYPDKNFLFHCFTGQIDKELDQVTLPSNLIVTSSEVWCFWWALTQYKYGRLITEKSSNNKFICLNNLNRPHRPALVAYLLARELEQFGIISCLGWTGDADNFLYRCQNPNVANIVRQGIEKYSADKLINIPYTKKGILHNYNHAISDLYQKSAVEIVSETTFFETSRFVSDKYIHSVLGANFPVIVGVEGTVAALTETGFDLFSDIVDHSYDAISDPADRLASAIDSNLGLLTDPHVDLLWKKHQQRFLANQNYMFSALLDRVDSTIQRDCQANVQRLAQLH